MTTQEFTKSVVFGKPGRFRWMLLGGGIATATIVLVFVVLTVTHKVRAVNGPQAVGPQIPLSVTFREALLSHGAVARIQNYSDKPLKQITVECSNVGLGKVHRFEYPVLEPHQTVRIGWHEGWDFSPGDTITVQAPGYAPNSATVTK